MITDKKILELRGEYRKKRHEILKRLGEFSSIKEEDIFYELCFCLLTPQTSARAAGRCIQELKKLDFLNSEMFNPLKVIKHVRFNINKSSYLMMAKKDYQKIKNRLKEGDSGELRDWLVKHVKGLGLKESAHFLRNIGYRDLVILDRHILKNLVKYGVIDSIPKTLTRKRYLEIEERFRNFSREVGINIDELDLLFWSLETGEIFK